MRFLVLGATGGTGLQLVRQAVAQDHMITAFVRNPQTLKGFSGRIDIATGDLFSPSELEDVLPGHDVVMSTFSPGRGGSRTWSQFATALARAMTRVQVRRLVLTSVGFLFQRTIFPPTYLIGRLFFREVVTGASGMEEVVVNSGLDWTIIRPPRLTDGPHSGQYRVAYGRLPSFGLSLSRADLAEFMLKTVCDDGTIGKIVGIAR